MTSAKRLTLTTLCLACGALLGAAAWAHDDKHDHDHDHAHGGNEAAHVHGVVSVDIAADGKELLVQLVAPAADIVGFEHEAHSDEEKKTVQDKLAVLRKGGLFAPASAAACHLEKTEIKGLGEGQAADGDKHDHGHDHAHDKAKEAKEAHDQGHAHGDAHGDGHDHDDDDGHGHSDVAVDYHFHCDNLAALNFIDVTLAQSFPSIHTINTQLALPKGQFSRTLKTGQTRLNWN